jgi:hypothetical protein
MKKILSFCFLISFLSLSQEENQGVELPQFVITGKEVYSFPVADKIKPELITTLSADYIMPKYSPEEVKVVEFSEPISSSKTGLDSSFFWNGNVNVLAGINHIPKVNGSFYYPQENLLIYSDIKGAFRRAYISNADEFFMSGMGKLKYFIPKENSFLGGSNLNLNINLSHSSYKMYGSLSPTYKRDLAQGNFHIDMKNLSGTGILYQLVFEDNYSKISSENFSENNFSFNGFVKIPFANFEVSGRIKYLMQGISNSVKNNRTNNFFDSRAFIGLNLSKTAKINFGFDFAKYDTVVVVNPQMMLLLKLDRGIVLFAEYTPEVEFLGLTHFLNQNKYLRTDSSSSLYFKKGGQIIAAVKIEYKRLIDFYGGVKYLSSRNFPYFTDELSTGIFSLKNSDAKSFSLFFNIGFQPGEFGYFYTETIFSKTIDTLDNDLPYYPSITALLTYGYKFDFGLKADLKLNYRSKSFADIQNRITLDAAVDISLKAAYKMSENLELTGEIWNILNKKQFIWKNYQELPLDVLFGINYRW